MIQMTKRTFLNVVLLSAIPFIADLWTVWEDNEKLINPWLVNYLGGHHQYPITTEWYLNFLFGHLAHPSIIPAIVIYRCSRHNQTFRIVATSYLFFAVLEFLQYLLWCSQRSNMLVYAALFVVVVCISWYRLTKYNKNKEKISQRIEQL